MTDEKQELEYEILDYHFNIDSWVSFWNQYMQSSILLPKLGVKFRIKKILVHEFKTWLTNANSLFEKQLPYGLKKNGAFFKVKISTKMIIVKQYSFLLYELYTIIGIWKILINVAIDFLQFDNFFY